MLSHIFRIIPIDTIYDEAFSENSLLLDYHFDFLDFVFFACRVCFLSFFIYIKSDDELYLRFASLSLLALLLLSVKIKLSLSSVDHGLRLVDLYDYVWGNYETCHPSKPSFLIIFSVLLTFLYLQPLSSCF